ncbi:MAG: carboxypeptidase-like regulatory domain-containing protein [Hymenobacter sp.]
MFLGVPALAWAQQTVKGTVTDEKNAALPGVTVRIKDGTAAVASNPDGTYSIQTSGPADILVFSFVGTVSKEIAPGTQTSLNVTLLPDAQKLNDVVVIGYGTASRADITGAVTSIKSEEFNPGVLTTPAELLQGKVAGLNITKSGDPNQRPSVVLRALHHPHRERGRDGAVLRHRRGAGREHRPVGPRRHRDHRRAEGRLVHRYLRHAGGQRGHHHHHQAGQAGPVAPDLQRLRGGGQRVEENRRAQRRRAAAVPGRQQDPAAGHAHRRRRVEHQLAGPD